MIIDNLETSLSTTMVKASGKSNEYIVERFIKPRDSIVIFPSRILSGLARIVDFSISPTYGVFLQCFWDMDTRKKN